MIDPQVRHVLEVDEVVTDAQLARLGLDGARFPGRTLTVRPLTTSERTVDVTFRALSERTLLREHRFLPHLAGRAGVRHALAIDGENWLGIGGGRLAESGGGSEVLGVSARPDAVFRHGALQVAVEYDAGYKAQVVHEKIRSMRGYDLIVWATPSAARSARMQSMHPGIRVETVRYW